MRVALDIIINVNNPLRQKTAVNVALAGLKSMASNSLLSQNDAETVESLIFDLEGEVMLGLAPERYTEWGKHYLLALA